MSGVVIEVVDPVGGFLPSSIATCLISFLSIFGVGTKKSPLLISIISTSERVCVDKLIRFTLFVVQGLEGHSDEISLNDPTNDVVTNTRVFTPQDSSTVAGRKFETAPLS